MKIATFILAIFIFRPAEAFEFIDGEAMPKVIPLPPGVWLEYRTKDGIDSTWYEDSNYEIFNLRIEYGMRYDIKQDMLISKKIGKKYCKEYRQNIISEDSVNGYPSTLYKSSCARPSSLESLELRRIIVANEATYFFTKKWTETSPKNNYDIWLEYISKISVCSVHTCRSFN